MVLSVERFDVVTLKAKSAEGGLFLVLSADHIAAVGTLIVAPLYQANAFSPISKLQPVLRVGAERRILAANELISLPRKALDRRTGNLADQHADITAALDYLFQGY